MSDSKQQLDDANKSKEEAIRQLKRVSGSFKELSRELEELRTNRDEIMLNNKDWDKKIKTLEVQLLQAQEERDLAERQRKQAVADRDELQHEIDAIAAGKNAFSEDKRRYETRITQLEEELEEEQSNTEQVLEKYKRIQMDLDKMTSDLHSEKSNAAKSENARVLIEKQNRELRDKLAELEELAKGRSKSAVNNLEAKLAALENQLQVESHERQNATRLFKKAEKRIRELQTQIEEEHKNGDGFKEQVKSH